MIHSYFQSDPQQRRIVKRVSKKNKDTMHRRRSEEEADGGQQGQSQIREV